jgi:hypothetical protein
MNILAKRVSLVAGFIVMTGVTVVSQSPLKLDFIRDAEAVFIRHPVATVAVVETAAVSSSNQKAAASANQQAAAAATASANAAAASANAAAAAAKASAPAPAPAPAAGPPVGTIVGSLPPGCVAETLNNVAYQRCGSTYYAAAMMGSNLVFVVKQP